MKRLLVTLFSLFTITVSFAQKQITLEDIWAKGTFRAKYIYEARSMADGEHYCVLTANGIDKYAYKKGSKEGAILDFAALGLDLKQNNIAEYSFSADEQKLLLCFNPDYIYRHSYVADYYVYDVKTKQLQKVSEDKIRLAEFSPTGDKIAYVKDNNLYIKDLKTEITTQITTDGEQNRIINGTTDWVYEEEFAITKGFFWNVTGDRLAYYRFDESQVKEFSMTEWGNLYPDEYKFKYPKAGEDNSLVEIFVYDVNAKQSNKIRIDRNTDLYYPRMQWTKDNNKLCVHKLNRTQNFYEIFIVDCLNNNSIEKIYNDENLYWIEQPEDFYFLSDNDHFIVKSERSGYNHFYLVSMKDKSVKAITKGDYDVDNLCYVDEKAKKIYFTAAQSQAYNRELFSITFDGKKQTKLSGKEGTYTADFSANGKYYICSYSDANTPAVYTINNNKGEIINTLEDNSKLKATLAEYGSEHKEFGKFKTENGDSLNFWIIKPSQMDNGTKYPVLFYVYGGPGSQEVLNSYSRPYDYMWFRMLAQQGYVIACVDGRGTGFRGEKFKKSTYMNLGDLETQDQIQAAKYFGSLDYIDKERIGIFGWSYGGYMSSLCITKGADWFKTAIAVAPVTTWRYYDNIYTERYMRKPQDNAEGYDRNSPINHADLLKGNFLLVHGTGDDNVHFQNSMDFTNALIKANKQFEEFFYPNRNHGIYGGNTRLHLYRMMTDFLKRKL
ncbi:MAG: S9 family peptidase [Bacteroidales bacterium]|jgi:dipeptidyl-peptidase-4|nr:S9 family peptidase [Bacteroidales bacterium]